MAETPTVDKTELLEKKPQTRGYHPVDSRWYRRPRDLPLMTWVIIEQMMMEPTIRLGLAMRAAPLMQCEFAYKKPGSEEWTQGVQANSREVAAFVYRQLQRIWNDLDGLLLAQLWGWSACEVVYCLTEAGTVEIDRLLPRHPRDVRALVRDGDNCGARFMRVANEDADGGFVDLDFPKAIFHAHKPQPGRYYGTSILEGAYSPWWDKWGGGGALESRRLCMQQNAIDGRKLYYPDGSMELPIGPGGTVIDVPNRDVARMIVEQLMSGGVVSLPSTHDPTGSYRLWELEEAKAMQGLEYLLQFPKDLDVEILRGMEIPDDILTAEASGAWEGKKVPMMAFYGGLDCWLGGLVRDIRRQVLDALVSLNYGRQWYEVTTKPLGEQAMDQAKASEQQQQPPPQFGGMPGMPPGGRRQGDRDDGGEERGYERMSLDPVAAVGSGVLSATELVKAAKAMIADRSSPFMRMRADVPEGARWVTIGGRKKDGGDHVGGFPVLLDADGNILKSGGPQSIVGKPVNKSSEELHQDRRRESHQKQLKDEAEGPLGNSRSWKRIVASQAGKWGIDEDTYAGIAQQIWEEDTALHEEREAAKTYARQRLNLTAGDINRLENQGLDYGSQHGRIKDLDVIGRELAEHYPALGWGGGYDSGSERDDYDALVWNLIKQGKQDAPSRVSREFHDRVNDFLSDELRRYRKQPKREEPEEEYDATEFSTERR